MILVGWVAISSRFDCANCSIERKYFSSIESFLVSDFWEETKRFHNEYSEEQVLNKFSEKGHFLIEHYDYGSGGYFFEIEKVPTMSELLKSEEQN